MTRTVRPRRFLEQTRVLLAVGRVVDAAEGILRRHSRRFGTDIYGAISSSTTRAADIKAAATIATAITPVAVARRSRWVAIVCGAVDGVIMAQDRIEHRYGLDGSDQLQETANLFVVGSHVLVDGDDAADLSLRAINAQVAIAYVSSGVVKAISPEWRSGRALIDVARTRTYGNRWGAEFLDNHPMVGTLICWSTIVMETLFPLIYLLPSRLCRPLSLAPHVFHLAIGHFMGLPRFYWAFTAAQPAIAYVLSSRKKA